MTAPTRIRGRIRPLAAAVVALGVLVAVAVAVHSGRSSSTGWRALPDPAATAVTGTVLAATGGSGTATLAVLNPPHGSRQAVFYLTCRGSDELTITAGARQVGSARCFAHGAAQYAITVPALPQTAGSHNRAVVTAAPRTLWRLTVVAG